MKILALADTHLGLFLGRTASAKKQTARRALQQFNYCIKEAIRLDVDYLVLAGDIFNRSKPPKWVVDQYYDAIQEALDRDIGIFAIPGNHDRAQLQPSLFDFMYPKYRVFNKLDYKDHAGVRWIGVPFIYENYQQIWKKVKIWAHNTQQPSVILCHQLFEGASFGPHRYIFRNREDVFIPRGLPARAQIITGHIHRAQVLFEGQVIYPGSTVRTSFMELIEPKGYVIISLEDNMISAQFKTIPTQPIQVLEFDGRRLGRAYLDEFLRQVPSQTRLLVRFLHTNLQPAIIRKLYQWFPSNRWPYLSFSPRNSSTKLQALYTTYNSPFDFSTVQRELDIKSGSPPQSNNSLQSMILD